MQFSGFRRTDGRVGTRNHVGILSTVVCANEVADGIGRQVQGTAVFTHQQGCCQTSVDLKRVNQVLIGLGRNPNLAGIILVSLGCESTAVQDVVNGISESGKPVQTIVIQEIGGAARSIAEGTLLAQKMVMEASEFQKVPCSANEIVLGLKCGSSDTTSGLLANPALGIASDLLVEAGGTSILGEVTEFIGAEHLLVNHAKDKKVAQEILHLVERMENRAKSAGVDIGGGSLPVVISRGG